MKQTEQDNFDNPIFRQNIFDQRVKDIVNGWRENPNDFTEINLESTHLSDTALHEIVKFLVSSECRIEKLNLSNNPDITDNGLRGFVEVMQKNKSLRELDISNNNISANTAQEISIAFHKNKEIPLNNLFFFIDLDETNESKFSDDEKKEIAKVNEIAHESASFLFCRNRHGKVDKVLPIRSEVNKILSRTVVTTLPDTNPKVFESEPFKLESMNRGHC